VAAAADGWMIIVVVDHAYRGYIIIHNILGEYFFSFPCGRNESQGMGGQE
jgi:hypothetical protein